MNVLFVLQNAFVVEIWCVLPLSAQMRWQYFSPELNPTVGAKTSKSRARTPSSPLTHRAHRPHSIPVLRKDSAVLTAARPNSSTLNFSLADNHQLASDHEEIVRDINHHFQRCTNSSGVFCETKRLLAGDYLWVARKTNGKETQERLLDCIIERKSYTDLCHSVTQEIPKYSPLRRIEVQLKMMQASTLREKGVLLEKVDGYARNFRSKTCDLAARAFLKELNRGERYPGVKLYECKNVTCTVQFLIDRHSEMTKRLRTAYHEALQI